MGRGFTCSLARSCLGGNGAAGGGTTSGIHPSILATSQKAFNSPAGHADVMLEESISGCVVSGIPGV